MNFTDINKLFMKLYKEKFGIIDIKEADFIPTLSNVLICFVVKTEKEKNIFLVEKYEKCCENYLNFIKNHKEYKDFKYEFMVLSKEAVKKKFSGNYYYAMH